MVRAVSAYFVILMVMVCHVSHTAMQEVFVQAQEAYTNNQCDRALQLYSSLEAKGPTVWYNMGNCLFKQGQYAKAVVCFKRAQRYAPWALYVDSAYNISLAHQQAALAPDRSLTNRVYEAVVYYTHPFSTLFLQVLFILWWLCTLYLLWYGAARYVGMGRRGYVSIALLGLLFLGGILFVRYTQWHTVLGVVTAKESALYVVPDEQVDSVGSVHETDIVTIIDEKSGWYKIKTSSGTGWIKATLVERV